MAQLSNYCEQSLGKNKISLNGFQSENIFTFPDTKFCTSNGHSLQCQAKYIGNIASSLHFSKDVIKERGLASLSYKEWDAKGVYSALKIIQQGKSRKFLKQQPKQQRICNINKLVTKPTEAKSCDNFANSLWRKQELDGLRNFVSSSHLPAYNIKSKIFLTEEPRIFMPCKNTIKEQSKVSLVYGFNSVSLNGNEDILKMLTKATAQWIKSNQAEVKKSKDHGFSNSTELISDEHMTEVDFRTCREVEKFKLQGSYVIMEEHKRETPLSFYYKTPEYLSPPKHVLEVDGKHKTAESLTTKYSEVSLPLLHTNLINPKGSKYLDVTENDFGRELNSADVDERCSQSTSTNSPCSGDKGAKKVSHHQLNEMQIWQGIISQWKSAYMIGVSWKDATLEQLAKDLVSVHNTQKISALITIATSAVAGTHADVNSSQHSSLSIPPLPAEILTLVCDTLRDDNALVRMASALCHFLIRDVSEEARKIMFSFLESDTYTDSWVAAQCLALEDDHNYLVIKRILTQLFEVVNKETEELCCYLLRKLSEHTNLIQAMLGEALSSGNWKDRATACRALSHLHGNISRDVKDKLNHLMWNDWSHNVRLAAAKTLGKLGLGKEVHDQIRKHLECDSWKSKVEALSLIGCVQIMTGQLLPEFLRCFANDAVAVRRQACQAAGLLQIKCEMVMNCLYQIIQNDPVWKIQAHAIKALGKIGQITPRVKELLLWCVHDQNPGVRIEAYRCIAVLHLSDSEFQHTLQDWLTLETHEIAIRELKRTLTALKMEHTGNQQMVLMIKQQMPKLCQKAILFPKVLKLDEVLKSGNKERDWLMQKTSNRKLQEPEVFRKVVSKELTGNSCPSAMSGTEFKSTVSELQAPVDDDSRPVSQQSVNTQLPSLSEVARTTEHVPS